MEQKVVIIGVGMAGTVHARVLEDIQDFALIAGIDTSVRDLIFRGSKTPVYSAVVDVTFEKDCRPDVIVVATPTPTHAKVCREVAECFGEASIIVEKPAADNLADALNIVRGIGAKQPVTVAYHMAFSPVVEWSVREVADKADLLGKPVSIESWGTDPYQADFPSVEKRLGNSWIDSGINALSVIERFVKPVECTSLRQIGDHSRSVFEGTFACEADGAELTASIMTSWHSTAASRWTKIRYSSGAELVMDHNAAVGYIRQDGRTSAMSGPDGPTPRRETHYSAMYRSWLASRDGIFSTETSVRLHELLLGNELQNR